MCIKAPIDYVSQVSKALIKSQQLQERNIKIDMDISESLMEQNRPKKKILTLDQAFIQAGGFGRFQWFMTFVMMILRE